MKLLFIIGHTSPQVRGTHKGAWLFARSEFVAQTQIKVFISKSCNNQRLRGATHLLALFILPCCSSVMFLTPLAFFWEVGAATQLPNKPHEGLFLVINV